MKRQSKSLYKLADRQPVDLHGLSSCGFSFHTASAISGRSLDDMNGSVRAHLTEVIDRKSMKKTVRKPETQ